MKKETMKKNLTNIPCYCLGKHKEILIKPQEGDEFNDGNEIDD